MSNQIERWPGESSGVPLATAIERWGDKASWPRLALRGRAGEITEHSVLTVSEDDGGLSMRLYGLGHVHWRDIDKIVVGSTRVPTGPLTGQFDGAIYIATPDGRFAVDLARGDRETIASWLLRALASYGSDSPFRSQIGLERAIASINGVYSIRAIDVAPEGVAA